MKTVFVVAYKHLASFVLCFFILFSTSASAEWLWVHGHNGNIQNPVNLKTRVKDDCIWVERSIDDAHKRLGDWCPVGTYVASLDLDELQSPTQSPTIGAAHCCQLPQLHFPWGLDIETFGNNIVHYTIPVLENQTVHGISVQFSNDKSRIDTIQVYNGRMLEQEFTGEWTSKHNAEEDIVLSLTPPRAFNKGLGVSISFGKLSVGEPSGSKFIFQGVGADVR